MPSLNFGNPNGTFPPSYKTPEGYELFSISLFPLSAIAHISEPHCLKTGEGSTVHYDNRSIMRNGIEQHRVIAARVVQGEDLEDLT